jgi:dTDP-4-amino-4,6-dideoxygalactose transaminase
MSRSFDSVEESWGRLDALEALQAAMEARTDLVSEFEEAFNCFIGGLDAAFLSSGREALYQALRLLGVGPKDEVILPAFLCSVVADTVLRAGATPILVDVKLPGGEVDLDLLLSTVSLKTKAVLIAHLYGIPVDFREAKTELERRNVAIVEDCAHCLGGTIEGRVVGSLGTFSLFSFNYDKPISLGNGGMLVCSDSAWLESFRDAKALQQNKFSTDPAQEFKDIEKFLNWLNLRRRQIARVRPPHRLSSLRKALTSYPLAARIYNHLRSRPLASVFHPVGAVRARLGLSLLRQYEGIVAQRNQNAIYVRGLIDEDLWGATRTLPQEVQPAYLRLNLFASKQSTEQVDYAAFQLSRAGFRAGRLNWPISLDQVPHLSRYVRPSSPLPNAHRMAAHCLNLPIHQNLEQADLDRMIQILHSIKN